ncbi:DnaD domain-containing protein [Chloroflexota bacterium]
MMQFNGFPARMEFTSLPNLFFSTLLPQITDIAELKTTLHILAELYRKKGYPRYVTGSELADNPGLMESLKGTGKPAGDVLRDASKMAVERGTFLHVDLDNGGVTEHVYFLNNESNRQIVSRVNNGEMKLGGLKSGKQTYIETEEQPDIFSLYEQNIGMLTPMIADELREAEKLYPDNWIGDAIKEAVKQNKRKWNYISAILERWTTEGKGDGTYPRYSKNTDPDKYIRGKYGHMVQR